MLGKVFVLKTLLVLWLVSVVLVETAHQKRDVHHRIVLKDSRPMRNHRTKHNTKHYPGRHEENKPKKSKKKPHKPVDSFEKSKDSIGFSPEENNSYEEYIKKRTKSKRHHSSPSHQQHHSYASTSSHGSKYHPKVTYHFHESKEPPVTSFYEKEPSYTEHYQEKPSGLIHENFKENVHHFENVEHEYKGPNKWPGPLSSPSSEEYYVKATKEKYNENKQKDLPKNHKLYSSENYEYQQPSKQVMEYYKPVTSIPKRHTHNYEYDTSESNTYKPISTSFQSFESNKKMMEASPLVGTTANFQPYTYNKKNEPSYKIENFSLRDVKENPKKPFKIVVDSFETTKENLEIEENSQNEESKKRSKEKRKRPSKNRKQKEKNWGKMVQMHKIKKTIYD